MSVCFDAKTGVFFMSGEEGGNNLHMYLRLRAVLYSRKALPIRGKLNFSLASYEFSFSVHNKHQNTLDGAGDDKYK